MTSAPHCLGKDIRADRIHRQGGRNLKASDIGAWEGTMSGEYGHYTLIMMLPSSTPYIFSSNPHLVLLLNLPLKSKANTFRA